MGAYCSRGLKPRRSADPGEVLQVFSSDYYGSVLIGDGREVACLPHKGCWFEIVATAESDYREVNRFLPGQAIRYRGPVLFLDRFDLSSGARVGLWHLVGFKLQLLPPMEADPPSEGEILARASSARTRSFSIDRPREQPGGARSSV